MKSKIKFVCALLVIAVLLQTTSFAANDALVYNAALEKLQQYKDLEDVQAAYDGFSSITSDYGQSVLMAAYCSAIIGIHGAEWDSALRVLEKLGANEGFVSLLQDNNLPTCTQLITYINGRQSEESGDTAKAVSLYNQVLDVWDAMNRTVTLEGAQSDEAEADYQQALAYMSSGDYTLAAEIFANLGDYKDCKTQLMLALSMANGSVPSYPVNGGTLTDSDIRIAANEAAEALERGDNTAAIRQCASILSAASSNKDLDTSALETIMLSAMNVFTQGEQIIGNSQTFDVGITISAIQAFDQNTLVTLNTYGTLEAFDLTTNASLWTVQMSGYDHEASTRYSDDTARLFSTGNGIIIAKYILEFSAYNSSGELIWSRYQKTNYGYESLFSLSDDGQLFAYIDESEDAPFYYYLVVCETATGNCVGKYKLTEGAELHGQDSLSGYVFHTGRSFVNGYTDCSINSAHRGTFSEDKSRYYMAVESNDRLAYYTVFLDNHGDSIADGQYRITYADEIGASQENVIAIDAIDTDLIVYHVSSNAGEISVTERINMYGGFATWSAVATQDGTYNISGSYSNACYLRSGSRLFTTLDNNIYIYNATSGEQLTGGYFEDANITSLYDLGNGFVQITLSDGDLGLCWLNSNGLHVTDQDITIPEGSATLVTGNLIDGVIEEQVLFGTPVSSVTGVAVNPERYAIIVPEREDTKIESFHLSSVGGYSHKLACIEDGCRLDASTLTADPAPIMDAGKEILIRVNSNLYSGANGATTGYTVLDGASQELKSVCYFTPSYNVDITDVPETGEYIHEISGTNSKLTATVASTGEERTLAESAYDDHISTTVTSQSVQRDSDGAILTAFFDGEQLQWFINAVTAGSCTVPEDAKNMITEYVDYRPVGLRPCYYDSSPFAVGGNGLIVFAKLIPSEEDSDFGDTVESYYGYNINTEQWFNVEDEAHGEYFRRTLAVGQENDYLAVVDADNQIRVYDMAHDDVIQRIPLKMPGDAIRNMSFALHDEYLLLNYNDRITELWSIKTGERVLREEIEGQSIKADKDLHRAYLIDHNEGVGICYDMSIWSELATIEGAEYFDARRENLYTVNEDDELFVINVPTLEQMILAGLTV